jgi:hypothetical protein
MKEHGVDFNHVDGNSEAGDTRRPKIEIAYVEVVNPHPRLLGSGYPHKSKHEVIENIMCLLHHCNMPPLVESLI